MQNIMESPTTKAFPLQIADFSELQARYSNQGIAKRAQMVIADAAPALQAANDILDTLTKHPQLKQALVNIRKNILLAGKIRASEARNLLMDASSDFMEGTRHKLAAWLKTMQRLSGGEGIAVKNGREYIPNLEPMALAVIGNGSVSNYLSMLQLVVTELAKIDEKNAPQYASLTSAIRRCATVLGDCENASAIITSIN